jgi:hypothetical protein
LAFFFYGVFLRFSAKGFQKHHLKKIGKSMSKTFYKKVEGEKTCCCHCFPSIFIAFLAVSLLEELKNTRKKENLKISKSLI